jgi:hypothetical protein
MLCVGTHLGLARPTARLDERRTHVGHLAGAASGWALGDHRSRRPAGGAVRAVRLRGGRALPGVDWEVDGSGSLVLPGASATFRASLHTEIDAGDHVLALLRVHALHRDPERPPLVFYGSRPRRLAG